MTTIKRTILDRIDPTEDRTLQLRFRKETVVDGKVTDVGYHRTVIVPGAAVQDQMSLVNAHLVSMGYSAVDQFNLYKIQTRVAEEHTLQVISAFKIAEARRTLRL